MERIEAESQNQEEASTNKIPTPPLYEILKIYNFHQTSPLLTVTVDYGAFLFEVYERMQGKDPFLSTPRSRERMNEDEREEYF